MSGGFFRGTTADQDTRFSNKTRKLLKAQKFPAELDEPVDVSKVNMDVIKPWIAKRVKDFLGFEDDVLINFIYTLLEKKQGVDGKILQIDGKMIQIQLTGFLEKNTGKFMKELWSLLISAQKNVSGIPQQFLDEKAEETRQKKAEEEWIRAEIMRKREEADKEAEAEHQRKISAAVESAKLAAAAAALKAGLAKPGPLHAGVVANVEEPASVREEPAAEEESEKSGRTSSRHKQTKDDKLTIG